MSARSIPTTHVDRAHLDVDVVVREGYPTGRIADGTVGALQPTVQTLKILFGMSDNCCSFPGCEQIMCSPEWDAVLGEVCHICARSSGGPRYDPIQSDDERNQYSNLILLCPTHHTLVDHIAPKDFGVDVLQRMKQNAEQRGGDRRAVKMDEVELDRVSGLALVELLISQRLESVDLSDLLSMNSQFPGQHGDIARPESGSTVSAEEMPVESELPVHIPQNTRTRTTAPPVSSRSRTAQVPAPPPIESTVVWNEEDDHVRATVTGSMEAVLDDAVASGDGTFDEISQPEAATIAESDETNVTTEASN